MIKREGQVIFLGFNNIASIEKKSELEIYDCNKRALYQYTMIPHHLKEVDHAIVFRCILVSSQFMSLSASPISEV